MRQPPDATAEREAGDPRVRHDPGRHREPERLRGAIQLAERDPGPDLREPGVRIHPDSLHLRQVDDQSVVAERETADAVPAATNGHA